MKDRVLTGKHLEVPGLPPPQLQQKMLQVCPLWLVQAPLPSHAPGPKASLYEQQSALVLSGMRTAMRAQRRRVLILTMLNGKAECGSLCFGILFIDACLRLPCLTSETGNSLKREFIHLAPLALVPKLATRLGHMHCHIAWNCPIVIISYY